MPFDFLALIEQMQARNQQRPSRQVPRQQVQQQRQPIDLDPLRLSGVGGFPVGVPPPAMQTPGLTPFAQGTAQPAAASIFAGQQPAAPIQPRATDSPSATERGFDPFARPAPAAPPANQYNVVNPMGMGPPAPGQQYTPMGEATQARSGAPWVQDVAMNNAAPPTSPIPDRQQFINQQMVQGGAMLPQLMGMNGRIFRNPDAPDIGALQGSAARAWDAMQGRHVESTDRAAGRAQDREVAELDRQSRLEAARIQANAPNQAAIVQLIGELMEQGGMTPEEAAVQARQMLGGQAPGAGGAAPPASPWQPHRQALDEIAGVSRRPGLTSRPTNNIETFIRTVRNQFPNAQIPPEALDAYIRTHWPQEAVRSLQAAEPTPFTRRYQNQPLLPAAELQRRVTGAYRPF